MRRAIECDERKELDEEEEGEPGEREQEQVVKHVLIFL